ncbi:MAG: acyl-CoA dehydrogenase [Rhodothermaceae bacterium TMED105]|jgi:acyl-CoA dehydrogenase|nr:MAG: acyl-CoA dehydrogenase [Rhodothermaceae bacterium TMED105]|tara:strand:- start:9851 stop:11860 length:2010 start_codon:yes stop_codon:yes gene_type:complete
MKRLFDFARKTLPRISTTEQIALESGTPGLERFAFSGRLNKKHLDKYVPHAYSKNDKEIMNRIVNIVSVVDEHEILRKRATPVEHPFWSVAKKNDFFGLIVPDEYGGKQLTPHGLSAVLQRLSSVSASIPVHVMVPASLGPAELLVHYGTEQQKEYFLPKLAKGAIPCFGLTSLHAGSDAAGSMTDTGTTYVKPDGDIGIRLNCDKRYITLAPVADIVGIAFKLVDPDGLLKAKYGKHVDGQITLALLERGHPNLTLGEYTDPLGVGFANGTVKAFGVEITVDHVIGGENGLGEGWKFLMEALAAGRGIALPAGAAGSSKMLSNAVAGYASIRKQFKTKISDFEGIQEKLAEMAMKTYEIDSLVSLMNCMLSDGERPPIMSAILKQRTTELGRDVVMHSMDIVAGSAICMGSQNFVAPAYLSSPIGITVEGSNTMTRSLLIFGQGLVRSHPHLLPLLKSIQMNDVTLFKWTLMSLVKDNVLLFIQPKWNLSPLERFVHFFSLSSNMSLVLGGDLKRKEFLSGRYADLLSYIVAGHAMNWYESVTGIKSSVVEAMRKRNLHRLQACSDMLMQNHPHEALHRLLYTRTVGNQKFEDVSDEAKACVSQELTTYNSDLRNLFWENNISDFHPNIKRIQDVLLNPQVTDDIYADIMKVDTFHVSNMSRGCEQTS